MRKKIWSHLNWWRGKETEKAWKHEKVKRKNSNGINVDALCDDEETKNVNLAHGGDEGMQILEEHVDARNEEHGGDEEMTNVEKTMGSVNIEPMIGE